MPGPGGINAARAVVNAPPDGYTMGLVTNGTAISVAAFNKLPFDPVKQFEMVSMLGEFDLVFASMPSPTTRRSADFIKAAKAQPGKLNVGTIAVGGTQNLGAELFKSLAGVNVQIVPYKNSPDIVVALLRNDVQMLVEFPPAVQRPGRCRRAAGAGDLGPEALGLHAERADRAGGRREGLRGDRRGTACSPPRARPRKSIDTMGKAMQEVLAMPDVKAQFAKVGVVAQASTPGELMERLTADIKKWNDVIDKAGIPKK